MLLEGKTALVVGVANKNSIAWGIAQALIREGATVILTYLNEKLERRVRSLAEEQDPALECIQLDATNPEEVETAFKKVSELTGGKLDMLVHSIAFAKKEDLEGNIVDTQADGFKTAQEVSAYTLISLSRAAMPLFKANGGGSVIAMSYLGGERVVPNYNVMGIAKASLEATVRYLAWDLGRENVRVNAVSAGPMNTLSGRGISGFQKMMNEVGDRAPLGRNVTLEEVGNAGMFLLSPLSSGITGEIMYVDAGYNIMGM